MSWISVKISPIFLLVSLSTDMSDTKFVISLLISTELAVELFIRSEPSSESLAMLVALLDISEMFPVVSLKEASNSSVAAAT